MNTHTRILMAAAVVVTFAAGCSSSSSDGTNDTEPTTTTAATATGSVPTDEELSVGFQNGLGYTVEEGDCAAAEVRGKVSDGALQAMADSEPDQIPDGEEEQVQEAIKNASAACQ